MNARLRKRFSLKITSISLSGSDSISPTQFRPYHESPDLAPSLPPVTNSLESYGAPQAEVVTSYQETYGAPAAPALDNYGSPQAPVAPAYTEPRYYQLVSWSPGDLNAVFSVTARLLLRTRPSWT